MKGLVLEIKTPAAILLGENKYRMDKDADRWTKAEGFFFYIIYEVDKFILANEKICFSVYACVKVWNIKFRYKLC